MFIAFSLGRWKFEWFRIFTQESILNTANALVSTIIFCPNLLRKHIMLNKEQEPSPRVSPKLITFQPRDFCPHPNESFFLFRTQFCWNYLPLVKYLQNMYIYCGRLSCMACIDDILHTKKKCCDMRLTAGDSTCFISNLCKFSGSWLIIPNTF